MNKPVFRVVMLTVVILLLLLFLLRNNSPFGKRNSSFASEPKNEITRIEFTGGKQKLILEKTGETWLLNGIKETRKSSILFIIRVLKEIRIKSPVSSELFETEITAKDISPVKVKVFEKRKLIKSFLVYKTRSNLYGNIMKMGAGAKPFIVYIPGFEGDIGSGFSLNELFWQPYTIFNYLPSEIESVEFESFADTSNSFSILNKNHHYFVSDGIRNLIGWDSALVTRYLSYFTRVPFESWAIEVGNEEQKAIELQMPIYRITVKSVARDSIVLTLWERMTGLDSPGTKDSDRLFGKTQKHEGLFILRYFDIDPLIKKRSYFFPE